MHSGWSLFSLQTWTASSLFVKRFYKTRQFCPPLSTRLPFNICQFFYGSFVFNFTKSSSVEDYPGLMTIMQTHENKISSCDLNIVFEHFPNLPASLWKIGGLLYLIRPRFVRFINLGFCSSKCNFPGTTVTSTKSETSNTLRSPRPKGTWQEH